MPKNKRSIPELRNRIREIAENYDNDELRNIADELVRNSPIKRAKNKSQRLTPELAVKIRDYSTLHPEMHERDVGQEFNVNPGRVSESLNHIR